MRVIIEAYTIKAGCRPYWAALVLVPTSCSLVILSKIYHTHPPFFPHFIASPPCFAHSAWCTDADPTGKKSDKPVSKKEHFKALNEKKKQAKQTQKAKKTSKSPSAASSTNKASKFADTLSFKHLKPGMLVPRPLSCK
jgi:hypothetical protein